MSGPDTWSFFNPVALRFGAECWRGAGRDVAEKKLLLLTSAGLVRRGTAARVRAGWGGAAEIVVCDRVTPNPEITALESLARDLRPAGFDRVIALGGGSVVDSAKVLAVLLADHAADLGKILRDGAPVPAGAALPVDAVPTIAGTGSEVTPFATVWDTGTRKKHSLSSPRVFPRVAYLDPELTAGVPPDLAVATGLDALSQALESIWNVWANPITLDLATRGVRLALAALPTLVASQRPDAASRGELLFASLLAGLAISHTRTALGHSISYPLTAHYGLPHGLACGFTLPAVLDFNAAADDGRIARAAVAVGCGSIAGLRRSLVAVLHAVGTDDLLRRHGIDGEKLTRLVPEMIYPGRADNNLRPATPDDVRAIMQATGDYLPACQTLVSHG